MHSVYPVHYRETATFGIVAQCIRIDKKPWKFLPFDILVAQLVFHLSVIGFRGYIYPAVTILISKEIE